VTGAARGRWPKTGPAAALLYARVACRPASMNALTANRMTSARTVTPGQAATFRDEPGDARSGVVAYERIFAGAGGQSRIELIVLVRDAQALPLMPNSGRCVPVCLCADLYTEPFSSCFGFADLQNVDCLGELTGAPGAAAELTEDLPGLELGIRPFPG
jgi:hypothetical protein